jgi:hypothetical protein
MGFDARRDLLLSAFSDRAFWAASAFSVSAIDGRAVWFLFQILIAFSVIASNIYWHWTPNPYIPAGAGLLLAWVLTWPVTRLRNRIGR